MNEPLSRKAPVIMPGTDLPSHLQDRNRAFQGIPGIEGCPGARLWATWYGGGTNEGVENVVFLATRKSPQDSWETVLVVDTPGNVRCFDPCLWRDPQGHLWLFWAQAVPHGIEPFVWAAVAESPELRDAAWSGPLEICPGVMMNKPLTLSTGATLLPVSNWKRSRYANPPEAVTAEVFSLDLSSRQAVLLGGAASEQEAKCFDEHMIVERLDGSLWMLVRTRQGIGESHSPDGGKTWSPIEPSRIQHTNSRFFIRRLQSGNLLLVKHGGASEAVGRKNLQALLSKDDGRSWTGGLLLDERAYASYPDGCQDEGGRIFIAYDYNRTKEKEILLAVFREDEVEQKTLRHADSRLKNLINKALGSGDLRDPRSLQPAGNA